LGEAGVRFAARYPHHPRRPLIPLRYSARDGFHACNYALDVKHVPICPSELSGQRADGHTRHQSGTERIAKHLRWLRSQSGRQQFVEQYACGWDIVDRGTF
jgi:hypothetical protein